MSIISWYQRIIYLFIYLQFQSLYQDIPCVIFHDVDLIPLDYRNIYGCSVEGPRHLSANLQQFRYLLPYENLFGGVIAIPSRLFESVDGFSNEYFGNVYYISNKCAILDRKIDID